MDKLNPANITETALSGAYEKIFTMVEGFGALLPQLAIALILLVVFYLLGRLMEFVVSQFFRRQGRRNLGEILGGLVKAGILLCGGLIAATVILPSVNPVDILGGLGLGSVAIGFAFKDILQNWLSGLLILIRQPFEIGDWIEVDSALGTVERIETRATMIKTFDGKLIVVPNSDIYTDKVVVWTHYPSRRSDYDVGIGYADDIDAAKEAILSAVRSVDGVLEDPEPQVLEWGLDASWVTLRARWWTDARSALGPRSQVIRAIKLALDDAGIDMPFETRVQLFHDQTEATDGDRTSQREGWPAGENPPEPRSRVAARSNGAGASE